MVTQERDPTWRLATGWAIVGLNTSVASLWAFWGAIENFHEGWHHPSFGVNVLWSFAYLAPMLIFTTMGLLAIRLPRVGAIVYLAVGLALGGWFISQRLHVGVLSVFMGGFGGLTAFLWWVGRPRPKRWAYLVAGGLPLAVALVSGVWPGYLALTRHDDGDRGIRIVEGNGVTLVWAPAGPGWPRRGVAWDEAVERCRHLTADGSGLAETPQDVWRLPTVDEIVRSLTRGGESAGGTWEPQRGPRYRVAPNKETPLWDPHSPIIYWWAADELDGDRAYRVVWNGRVFPIHKDTAMGSQAFRAVRAP